MNIEIMIYVPNRAKSMMAEGKIHRTKDIFSRKY